MTRSFNERDPVTGADGAKINFNALEFKDRPAQNELEEKLVEDVIAWLDSTGTESVVHCLKSHIPGSDLVELPLGSDHSEIKAQFAAARPQALEGSTRMFASAKASAVEEAIVVTPEPPQPKRKKAVELTEEQAKALGVDF